MPPTARDPTTGFIEQNLIDDMLPSIQWKSVHESNLARADLEWLWGSKPSAVHTVGLAASYSQSGGIPVLALAYSETDSARVLVVQTYSGKPAKSDKSQKLDGRQLLEREVLRNPTCRLFAFDITPLVLTIYLQLNSHVTDAIDIVSALPVNSPLECIRFMVQMADDSTTLYETNIRSIMDDVLFQDTKQVTNLVQRAWISAYTTSIDLGTLQDYFYKAPKIDTTKFSDIQLRTLAKWASDSLRADILKPLINQNEIANSNWNNNKQNMQMRSSRFQKRLQRTQPDVQLRVGHGAQSYVIPGKVDKVAGRLATVKTDGVNLYNKTISSVASVGRGALTNAEIQRARAVLGMLQGIAPLWENPFLQAIWLTSEEVTWPDTFSSSPGTAISIEPINPNYPINSSQSSAVEEMLSNSPDFRIVLVQGPPGTGKTSVIATYVLSACTVGQKGIWLTAQSNVAVKNIAEKLHNIDFPNWKLIVSADFHFDWHEHLYHQVSQNIIRSDELPTGSALAKALDGVQVILCTVSMLSNLRLKKLGFMRYIPLTTLIIDEASQIEVGDYVSVFNNYKSIRKVCFIGDDKQLPPFGTDDNETLQSIFEMEHLRPSAKFLDTQYRMPPQIGDFISKQIYDKNLKSNPLHPITSATIACHFVDVAEGAERHSGTSWVNHKEVEAIVHLAQHFQEEEKSFRIITPYDAQRQLIEDALKENELYWNDKCFNVDSFQGNEDHYIIISVVRSRDLGFLTSLRRTNVMLTRCQKGMYICSSKAFLKGGKGAQSLVGKMAAAFGEESWISWEDLVGGNF